jgi:predicted KAP-like P-loop ATPase
VPVLDFNPWMFSGAEQLVDSFFIELVAQLRLRPGLGSVANDLADFGEAFSGLAWLPMVGPWIERGRGTAKLLSKILQRRMEGTTGRRDRLKTALAALEHPIVVILDDIDRLSSAEIREVFKLVRLTAQSPRVGHYLRIGLSKIMRNYLREVLRFACARSRDSSPGHWPRQGTPRYSTARARRCCARAPVASRGPRHV